MIDFMRQREVERLGGTYNPSGATFQERYINIDPFSDVGIQLMMNDPDFNGRHSSNPRPGQVPGYTNGVPTPMLPGFQSDRIPFSGSQPSVPMTPSMPTNRDANDNNNIGMAQLPTEFPMTSTPSDNPPPHNQDQMTDILPLGYSGGVNPTINVLNANDSAPTMPDVNPITQVQQSNNVKIPYQGYQPSVPINKEPPKQVLQSQPDPKKVSSYKPPKPKKSIYESLRERRAQKQPAKKKTPKPSVNRAIKPMQARRAGSSMRSLALQNMKRDKQATDVAQAKTDAIQAQIAKLRKK